MFRGEGRSGRLRCPLAGHDALPYITSYEFVSVEQAEKSICRSLVKPSDGLEPSTPSLPCAPKPLPWVATGCRSGYLRRFHSRRICDRLPPVAPAWLHKCSILDAGLRRRSIRIVRTLFDWRDRRLD